MQAFVESIGQLETDIDSSPADDVEASGLQLALARVKPGSISLPAPPVLKRPLPFKLCEVVCVYRLIDVLYDIQEQDKLSPFINPSYPKHRFQSFLPTQVMFILGTYFID